MIFKKHDINHFYVGELYIGSPLGIVQKKTITYKDLKKLEQALEPKERAVMNGAIVFEETTKGTILNLRKCRIFDGPLLTIFYYDGHEYDDLDMPPVSLKNQLEESAPEELTLTKALKLYQGVKR